MKTMWLVVIALMFTGFRLLWAEPTASSAEAPNWCEQAKLSLVDEAGEAVDCSMVSKRCVMMNNYWCQKHTRNDPWKGTPGPDGKDGREDNDGHAIFASVEWSARAMAIDLRSKYRKGKKTAVEIAAAHSPWCDTLGSKAVVQGHGRTCKDGRAKPPDDFAGPRCKEPTTTAPTHNDCQPGCNCPPEIAETLVKGLDGGIGINDDLQLFDLQGHPGPNLTTVMKNLAFQEQSIHVSDSVILSGIKKLGN